MSPYQDPKDAVVSVWRHADDPDAFLGSGVFVSPQLILTAKHVIGSRRPEEIHIGLIDGLEQRAPAQTFHVHEQYDVALIELVRAFPKQGLVKPDANRASLDDARVALAGVNLDTKNRDLCDGYTLGNWNAATGAYLFDHAPRKGFSGGIVVLDSCAVGVIIQRHREDQQGVMIPLYAVAEWLQSVLGPTLLEFEPADLPIPDPSLPAAFTQDLQTIRQRIHDRLQPAPVKGLREALVQELDTDAVARALVPSHPDQLVDALDHLHQATESCLQPPAAPDADRLEAITAAAREIFGWLIVLAVDHQQAQAAGHDFDPWQGGMQVDIPLNSEAGIEALVSALGDRAAAFKLTYDHHHSPRVSGAHSLIPDELELGIGPSDQLREILKRIWMR
ncbi:MAG: serine protease, partial [Candidatus Tectomicrobia bacterium]|nr:serine protease [Candidatus Tectomicrobia bacterium]